MTRTARQNITLIRIGLLGVFIILSALTAAAQVPQTINFQGYLTDADGTPIIGNRSMIFKLYTVASGGTAAWTETQTVTIANGVYNVRLGSVMPITLATSTQYYLAVTIGTDPEMTPRTALTSVMSALMLRDVTIKGSNTFVGELAGRYNTGGYDNTFVGRIAGAGNTDDHMSVRHGKNC